MVVKNGAEHCPLCVRLAPVLDELAGKKTDVIFIEVNLDLFFPFDDVSRIPDTKFIKNGKVLD